MVELMFPLLLLLLPFLLYMAAPQIRSLPPNPSAARETKGISPIKDSKCVFPRTSPGKDPLP
ncbi:retinol dehydrogenase 11 [Homo sapiens]|uniref:Retinol dehydrogenase 11 n=1 Tax=Homo sapiens TaxID=9606 RepID=G3V3K0_HUMAN|nr:retinol dehydrogenase 11 [Homo sapiens]KAI4061342.1 retinol dehydrogenase 11 [Homo sapiens]